MAKGVILVVIYPAIRQIVTDKIGIIGKPFLWVLEWALLTFTSVFETVAEKYAPDEAVVTEEIEKLGTELDKIGKDKLIQSIDKIEPLVEPTLRDKVLPKILKPLRIVFYGSAGFTLILLAVQNFAMN